MPDDPAQAARELFAALQDAGQVRVLADNGDVQPRTVRTGVSDRLRIPVFTAATGNPRWIA